MKHLTLPLLTIAILFSAAARAELICGRILRVESPATAGPFVRASISKPTQLDQVQYTLGKLCPLDAAATYKEDYLAWVQLMIDRKFVCVEETPASERCYFRVRSITN